MCTVAQLLIGLVNLYSIVLLVYAVLSWIPDLRFSQFERFLAMLVEPLLLPIRRIVPPMGGIDIAFLILILILQFLVRPLLTNWEYNVCAALY